MRRRGFTLAEVVISMGVLAIGLLAVISAFTFGGRATQHADNLTQAMAAANDIVNVIRGHHMIPWFDFTPSGLANEFDGPPGTTAAVNAAPFDRYYGIQPYAGFTRTLSVVPLATNPGLARITVTITWYEDGGSTALALNMQGKKNEFTLVTEQAQP